MKTKVKMFRVKFPEKPQLDLEFDSDLLELYKKHSKVLESENWSYRWYGKPKSVEGDAWEKMFEEKTDEYLQIIKENPRYDSFVLSVDLNTYAAYSYALSKNITIEIVETFEVEVLCDVESLNSELLGKNIQLMQKQYEQLKEFSIGVEQQAFNAKCSSPVSDAFLSKVNEVLLLEDCCSDALQKSLNEGWRILSVAPQPNQRRPDYILGRISDFVASDSAKRDWT